MLKYFPRILQGRRKNEEYAERNNLGWKGLIPLVFKILEKSNLRDTYGHQKNNFQFLFFWYLRKLLSTYTETTLNGDFNPKSAIISKNTNTKKKFLDSY